MNDPSSDEQDRRDMQRLVAGGDAALNELMRRHAPRLFNYLVRQLQDESKAADIAQETFVRVYTHREKFRPEAKFSTWLYTIATNLVRDHSRWRQRHPEVSFDAKEPEQPSLAETLTDAKNSPDAALVKEERSEQVRKAVQALPEELREPLLLFEYENFSQEEIAQVLNCSRKAVEMRIYHARQALRKSLSPLLEDKI